MIIAITRTGDTATYIANAKPHGVPIFSFTNSEVTLRQLSLVGSTVSFPIKDIQLLKIPEREKVETSTLKLDNKRVLLIEDDSIARTLMKFILTRI